MDSDEEKIKRKERKKQMKQYREISELAFRCRCIFIVTLIIFIAVDGWNLCNEFENSKREALFMTITGELNTHSNLVALHVIGLVAAWNHYLTLSAGCIAASLNMKLAMINSRTSSFDFGKEMKRNAMSQFQFDIDKLRDARQTRQNNAQFRRKAKNRPVLG